MELAEDLQRLCDTYGGDTIAACIVEPVEVPLAPIFRQKDTSSVCEICVEWHSVDLR